MDLSELEEIIKQILDNNLMFDFHDRLKERLNEEYKNMTMKKFPYMYNINDPDKYGVILIQQMDFESRHMYIELCSEESKIIRVECSYNPKIGEK